MVLFVLLSEMVIYNNIKQTNDYVKEIRNQDFPCKRKKYIKSHKQNYVFLK